MYIEDILQLDNLGFDLTTTQGLEDLHTYNSSLCDSNGIGIKSYIQDKYTYVPYSLNKKLQDNYIFLNNKCFTSNNSCSSNTRSYTGFSKMIDKKFYIVPKIIFYSGKQKFNETYVIDFNNYTIERLYLTTKYNYTNELDYYYCLQDFNSNNRYNPRFSNIGTSYLDDFMYTNRSSDIFITMLYIFIPIFIFILALKVFKKGLFK